MCASDQERMFQTQFHRSTGRNPKRVPHNYNDIGDKAKEAAHPGAIICEWAIFHSDVSLLESNHHANHVQTLFSKHIHMIGDILETQG